MSFQPATRLDAVAVREYEQNGEKKSAFSRIGVAFPMKQGPGWQILLDAMPAPVDGQFKILLMAPKEKTETTQQSRDGRPLAPAFDADDIGF